MTDTVTTSHVNNIEDADQLRLLQQAQEADAADHSLTVGQALRKYRTAVFWAGFLSLTLWMEGFDLVLISSLYGQTQFKERFGTFDATVGGNVISPAWQTGISNAALCGQIIGLAINGFVQDWIGCRKTMMLFLSWLIVAIFAIAFAPSLAILALGECLCGIPWGVFQTLSTSYACEVVPIRLRPYVTAWVCMCWGGGITVSSGVVRAVVAIDGDLGWRLPLLLQWVWPVPVLIGVYFAPESPWSSVRRGKFDEAATSIKRLSAGSENDNAATLALIRHTTSIERKETAIASYLDCFKGTNLRRTEINCVVWAAQILCGNGILGFSVLFLQAAGFSELNSFNINIGLSCCYIIGGIISWFLLYRFGRATIYMCGLAGMLVCLLLIGGLGFSTSQGSAMAVAILFLVSTLINMMTTGPVCYPIVAETPSGPLRYKTIVIGRTVYNLTGLVNNILTPRMVQAQAWGWGAKTGLFFAGTNMLCLTWCWFRLPETKDRSFGEIDILFENRIPARKFKSTKADLFENYQVSESFEKAEGNGTKVEVSHVEIA